MIPYVDLKAQYLALKPEIHAAVERVFENSAFVLGDEVEAFDSSGSSVWPGRR